MIYSQFMIWMFQGRYIPDLYDLYDLYDLHDLAHAAGWEPYNLHDLEQDFWVGSILLRSCTAPQQGRFVLIDDLERYQKDRLRSIYIRI